MWELQRVSLQRQQSLRCVLQSVSFGRAILRQILQPQEDSHFCFGYLLFQSLWILLEKRFVEHPLPFKFVILYQFVTSITRFVLSAENLCHSFVQSWRSLEYREVCSQM